MTITSFAVPRHVPGTVTLRFGCREKATICIPFDLTAYNRRRLIASINGWEPERPSTVASTKENDHAD